jgi:hypothetical protein
MIYFTRGWANGELSDVESEEVVAAYEKRLTEILPRLPKAFARLAREINLHDGIIEQVQWNPAEKLLRLSLVCGDLQNGYTLIEIMYGGALLGEPRIEALRRAACARDVVLLYDEVDIQPDGLLTHRLLFHPRDEVTIDFETVSLSALPRSDKRVNLGAAFIETVIDAR